MIFERTLILLATLFPESSCFLVLAYCGGRRLLLHYDKSKLLNGILMAFFFFYDFGFLSPPIHTTFKMYFLLIAESGVEKGG